MPPRPEPGMAAPIPMTEGEQQIDKWQHAGFTPAEIAQTIDQRKATQERAGFTANEIDNYWGHGTPNYGPLSAHFSANLTRAAQSDPQVTRNPIEAMKAGWDNSDVGLALNGKLPTQVLPQNASLFDRVMNGVGQFAGDAPVSVAGFFGGGSVGVAAGGATGPAAPIAAPVLGLVGAGAGAAGAPEATRQILLDAYKYKAGQIRTWQDAVQVVSSSLWTTTKAAVTGAIAAPIGGAVGGRLAAAGASPLISGGVDATTNALAATTVGSALDGHMPDAKDFEAGALLALGFHTGSGIAALRGNKNFLRAQNNLENIYRQTGVPPWEAAARAQSDPLFRQELFTQDVNGETVAPQFRASAPAEPQAYKPASRATPAEPEPSQSPAASHGRIGAPEPKVAPATLTLPKPDTLYANDVPHAMSMLATLERSGDSAISPAGAVGKYQIMPGTARAYMGRDFDVKQLFDPAVNEQVAQRITADLFKRYNGNMTAIAIAYNAGPGRAGEYMKAGEGTRLVAVPDKTMRSGWRFETEPSQRNEAMLPRETQEYIARARFFMSGKELPEGFSKGVAKFPSFEEASNQEGEGGGGEPPVPVAPGGEGEGEPPGKGYKGSWEDEILKNVGEQPKREGMSLDRTISQFVSELTPARRLDDRLIKSGDMDRTKDLGAEDMFRQTYASDARAGVFVRYGAVDPITLDIKPGSKSVLDAVRQVKTDGGTMDGWKAYMLAARTMDKAKQGIDTGFNPAAAADAMSDKKAAKKYERATGIFNDVMNSVLDYSRDSGVHSDAQVEAMIRDNPHYVSMRRIMGDDDGFGPSTGRGFRARDSLRRMEGSDRQIVDPIQATLDNMRVLVKMADRNRAIGHVIGMQERGEADMGLLKLSDQATLQGQDESTFKPYGIEASGATDTYGPLLAMRSAKSMGPNDFLFFRDGKAETWRAKDPLLAQLMRGADSPGQMNPLTKTLQTFASVERAGIVVNPDFPTRVQLRHQITAFVMDPLHPPPFVTWLRGISHVLGQDELFQGAVAKGAMGAALADMDARWLSKDMDAVLSETGTYNAVWNAVRHPLQFAQLVSERMDAAARVGYTLHAQSQGVEPIKAATMSRKAYLDYAERGTANIANLMAQTIPFFRPHLLGLKQGWEAFAERPLDTLKYATIGVALPMAALYALNYLQDQVLPDDEKYANLPQWERDQYFITPQIAGVRLKLKTPPNVGMMFGGMVNRMLDAMLKHDPHAFDGWAKQFLGEFVPPVLPTVVQAPIEVVTNRSFYSGKSLVPDSMDRASGYMQYTPYTSEAAKAISRVLGPPGLDIVPVSPILLDHMVKSWTGNAGYGVLKQLDLPLGGGNKKPWEVADTPFVGSFFVRHPGVSAQPVQSFYDAMSGLEAQQADFGLAMKHAENGDASELDQTAPASQYAQAIAPIKQAIERQAAAIQGVYQNKDMTPDDKRQLTDQMTAQMIETAKGGLQAIDQIKADAKTQQPDQPAEAPQIPAQSPYAEQPPAAAGPPPGADRGMVPST